MNLYDNLIRVGNKKVTRPVVSSALSIIARLPLYLLLKLLGRRMVTAFAVAPATFMTGSDLKQAPFDARLLYNAVAFTVDSMKLDTYCLMADVSVEAEACGCQVKFEKGSVPAVISHVLHQIDDISKLRVPDPYHDGRMPVFLKCLKLMKAGLTGLKLACVTGPFTLALNLRGSDIYLDIMKKQQLLDELMDFTTQVCIRYSQALVKEGADMLLIAEPACSQLSLETFRKTVLPNIQKTTKSISRNCILHICGKTDHLINGMCESGASAVSVDEIDLPSLLKRTPPKLVVVGNIGVNNFVYSSPDEISEKTKQLLKSVKEKSGFIIAPGCDLPPQSAIENITAFVSTVKDNLPNR